MVCFNSSNSGVLEFEEIEIRRSKNNMASNLDLISINEEIPFIYSLSPISITNETNIIHLDNINDNIIDLIQNFSYEQIQNFCTVNKDIFTNEIKKIRQLNITGQLVCNQQPAIVDYRFNSILNKNQCFDNSVPLSIIGDGNCFYRTISYGIFGNQNKHKLIRLLIVFIMCDNYTYFNQINLQLNRNNDTQVLIKETSTLKSYAGELPVQASSILTNRPIIVYSLGPKLEYAWQSSCRFLPVIRIGFGWDHFVIILFKNDDCITNDFERPDYTYFSKDDANLNNKY